MFLSRAESFKYNAIQWRNDHLTHCNETCNVSLFSLLQMAKAAGAVFTEDEENEFQTNQPMEFRK
jgi:hypothetical protein